MRRLRPLLVLIALVAFTASCATGPADDTASTAAAPVETASAEDAASQDRSEPGSTTQATIDQMLSMDPDVLASAHDHDTAGDHSDHSDHSDHTMPDHPNGIDPERLVIPAIGVDADMIDLGLQDDGTMEVPNDFAQTGWFDRGPKPGRVGPAVIAGHVDSTTGPAVFFRLNELSAGDEIEVHGEDGDIVTFVVRELEQHPKDDFPTEAVYSGTPGPELRLITCSGEFDQGERSYRDNTIVFAERVD